MSTDPENMHFQGLRQRHTAGRPISIQKGCKNKRHSIKKVSGEIFFASETHKRNNVKYPMATKISYEQQKYLMGSKNIS